MLLIYIKRSDARKIQGWTETTYFSSGHATRWVSIPGFPGLTDDGDDETVAINTRDYFHSVQYLLNDMGIAFQTD